MRYLSVCSGIEAATVAWHPLGWQPVGFSEIEAFPSAVLAHHYPDVRNYGDMTKYKEWELESIDLLVGGTPCQSFSVAGLRRGLEDPRGNLALTYVGILDRLRPQWCLWENVPGVLSSSGGRDFGSFLGALAELGYGFAYRTLDAQYFGVAQRRRRVFVVGYLGDWRPAAEVLFERESVRGDPAPSREARQEIAGATKTGARPGCEQPYGIANCLTQRMHKGINTTLDEGQTPILQAIPIHDQATRFAGKRGHNQDGKGNGLGVGRPGDPAPTLTKGDKHAVAQPITFGAQMSNPQTDVDMVQTLQAKNPMAVAQPIAPTLTATNDPSRSPQSTEVTNQVAAVHAASMAVRRLTPIECERLQGFPDNYTNIPWRKAIDSPDGPRYKALGNSMAVPVMKWIGERLELQMPKPAG
jgi:DNA (cytosine-5)-methyltransferase 1